PSLAVTVRRLRDAGYQWGHIFWLLLPVAGVIVLYARNTVGSSRSGVTFGPMRRFRTDPPWYA
ncbi:MAG TPA: hypothetical protein VLZ78_11410, partial [Terrimesophilobacter sp.]|nr:hypothetical protein [Terrimesophilobacter sp.]